MDEYEHIRVSLEGPVTRITLSRPERRNALSLDLMRELLKAFGALGHDCRLVILDAAGPAFSAGHDLGEMVDQPKEFYDELFAVCTELMEGIHELPQPVVAKVQGVATAAGCQLVASCDLAVAADDAWFATPGVKIGLFCSTPMVPVARAVGRKRAMQMLLTGEPVRATTAVEWGLVNQAVPADQLEAAVQDLAARILAFSPETIGIGKRAFYAQAELHEHEAYRVTKPVMAANAATPDAQEGMAAFLEKRPPQWSGGG